MSSFRGFHYDIARGAYLRPKFFHEAIRHAARCGYTHFFPYLENMIRLPSMEKACPDVAYNLEDWRDFEKTAEAVGIELVPHFNVIGHTEHICEAYPELSGTLKSRDLDIERKETRKWVLSCLDEFCSVSQGRYFLIGGDEWQAPNDLLVRYRGSIGRVWAEYLNEMIGFLSAQGRIPIVWHDMLLHYPEALDVLSKEAVVAFWFYDADADYAALETFKDRGFKTIVASGCLGHVDRRRAEAVKCAVRAMEQHETEGFLMTSWETVRWESQQAVMEITSEILSSGKVSVECDVLSDYTAWKRGAVSKEMVLEQLGSLERYPDYQSYLSAELTGDGPSERELYSRFQYQCGPLYQAIGKPFVASKMERPSVCYKQAPRFDLEVLEDTVSGPSLRFVNGAESFVIYPNYGATLQDWRLGNQSIIAHTLPSFLNVNQFAPGGYRSFTGAFGFRPIWALGAHHNPCILWQYPFSWKRLDTLGIHVELALFLEHVDVRYRIGIEADRPGFSFEAEAIPKKGGLFGTWSFNLPLALEHPERTRLDWGMGAMNRSLEPGWIPGANKFQLTSASYNLAVESEGEPASGCFVDCGSDWLTPDLHGVYRVRDKGVPVIAKWKFRGEIE